MKKIIILIICSLFLIGCGKEEKETIVDVSTVVENLEETKYFSLSDYYNTPIMLKTTVGDVEFERYLFETMEITKITKDSTITIINQGLNNAYVNIDGKLYYADAYISPKSVIDNIDFHLYDKFVIKNNIFSKSNQIFALEYDDNNKLCAIKNANNTIEIIELENMPSFDLNDYEIVNAYELLEQIEELTTPTTF